VVLGRRQKCPAYDNLGPIQYSLIPRRLINCPSSETLAQETCVLQLSGSVTYIPAAGSFPRGQAAETSKKLMPFDKLRCVYAPSG
jgi:hypothetical protein